MPKYKTQPEVVLGNVPEIKVPEIQVSFNRTNSKIFEGKISSSNDASGFIRKVFKSGEIELQEQFIVLYLDQSNKIIGYYKHSKGAINATVADTRIILATALKCAAIGMIVSHNHPSGNLKPSDADIQLTKRIADGAKQHDIKLLDHLIVTKHGYYSFADEGLLGVQSTDEISGIIKYKPEITFNTNRTTKTGKKAPNGIEIRFGDTKPTEEVRTMLKQHGYRFSEKQKIWYAIENEKTKKLADELLNAEVDVDDTKYEKLFFWAKVKNYAEYQRIYGYTEFYVNGETYYQNKNKLEKAFPNIQTVIANGKLNFKKFYNKVVDDSNNEDHPEIPEHGSEDRKQAEHDEDLELLELEAKAELELLKMEMERKKKPELSGVSNDRLKYLERKAWLRQSKWQVLNFK